MKKKKDVDAATERKERTPVLYWATIVTLVIVVLSFVIFPAFDGFFVGHGQQNVLAKHEGRPVSAAQDSLYASNYWMMYNQVNQQYGEQASMYMNYYQGYIAQQTVYQFAVYNMLQKAGIQMSAQKVNKLLREQCGDWGLGVYYLIDRSKPVESSNFNEEAYQKSVQMNNQQVKVVRSNIATRSTVEDFQNDLQFLSIASQKQKDFFNDLAKKTVSGSYFQVTDAMIPSTQFEEYINANTADFTQLDLTVIRTNSKKEAEDIKVEVSEDAELFAERALTYNSAAFIQNQGKFQGFVGELALQLNNKKQSITDKIVALQKDEISEVLAIDGFFYLFKANETAIAANAATLVAKSKDKVINYINLKDASVLDQFVEVAANDLAAAAKTTQFEKLASANNATIETMEAFPLNYGNASLIPSLSPMQFAGNETFLKEAFSAKKNDVLSPIKDGDVTYLFKVASVNEQSDKKATGNEEYLPASLIQSYLLDPSRTTIYDFAPTQE